jgi:hypothetical protein
VYAPRRNWDSPQPPSRRLVCPFPPVSGGRGTLAGEKGVGRVPIPTRGVHCGTLYIYVLCGYQVLCWSWSSCRIRGKAPPPPPPNKLYHGLDSNLKYRAGYLMSCAFGDLDMALALAPVIHIPLMVFGGFYLNSG